MLKIGKSGLCYQKRTIFKDRNVEPEPAERRVKFFPPVGNSVFEAKDSSQCIPIFPAIFDGFLLTGAFFLEIS